MCVFGCVYELSMGGGGGIYGMDMRCVCGVCGMGL